MHLLALCLLISAISVSPSIGAANADVASSDLANLNQPDLALAIQTHQIPPHADTNTRIQHNAQDQFTSSPNHHLITRQSVPIADKHAIICPIVEYEQCLMLLPNTVAMRLPSYNATVRSLGLKSAMVFPIIDDDIAGIVVVNDSLPLLSQSVAFNGKTYQLDLDKQAELTLWHEIGHLNNIALQGHRLPNELSAYEHEWLADIYLTWRLAHESNNLILAWQQLHRRNMAVMNNKDNMSHWSSPQLLWLLSHYQAEDIVKFDNYSHFISVLYPQIQPIKPTEMKEIASLVQRTFGDGSVQPLPRYMYWRQAQLIEVLHPTLELLMGDNAAKQWLIEQFDEAPNMINAE